MTDQQPTEPQPDELPELPDTGDVDDAAPPAGVERQGPPANQKDDE